MFSSGFAILSLIELTQLNIWKMFIMHLSAIMVFTWFDEIKYFATT